MQRGFAKIRAENFLTSDPVNVFYSHMNLATLEKIISIEPHPNADAIEIATVLGYKSIVLKNQFAPGEQVIFIRPDTVLPDAAWSEKYKKRSNRVKAIKLRGVCSEGITEKTSLIENFDNLQLESNDVSNIIGVQKYEPPAPQDLAAKGLLPYGIPVTDETRWEEIVPLPVGELVDVTLKRDGQSWTAYAVFDEELKDWVVGITGRRMEYKLDNVNNYTSQNLNYNVLNKLLDYAKRHNVSIALRGESCGAGIQKFQHNPHSAQPLNLAFYSVYLVKEHRYTGLGDQHYFYNVCKELDLPTVELIEAQVPLTMAMIEKYAGELTTLNGVPFEGVVVKGKDFHFKVINRDYDSKK